MDSLIAAAARALAVGDALGALNRVSLRDDAPALALRGIALAQLGEYPRARELLRRAARRFGAHEQLARARCVVAQAEIALALRDLSGAPRTLASALATLEAHDDHANALHARLIAIRRLLLLGRLAAAASALAAVDMRALPPPLLAVAELAAAELALRALRTAPAQAALARAGEAAERALIPALAAEVAAARTALDCPAARCTQGGDERMLRLDEVEALLASGALPAPGHGSDSGLAWAEGSLWVGQYRERKIHRIDPATGKVLRTIESDRFVTGVSWVDGELWHGTWEGEDSDLRRIDPASGAVLERVQMPPGVGVSGLETDGADLFYCGGGPSGKVRAVRRTGTRK